MCNHFCGWFKGKEKKTFLRLLDELKTNAERFLNNMAKKKSRYDLDEFERFVKEDIYSISGKKPIIKIVEME